MGGATPEHEIHSVDKCGGFYVDSPSVGNSPLVQGFCDCSNKNVIVQVETVEFLDIPSLSNYDELVVRNLGENLNEKLHVHDSCEQLSHCIVTPNQVKLSNSIEERMPNGMDVSAELEAKAGKSLSKSATFPSSEGLQSSTSPIKGRQGCLSKVLQDPSSSEFESPVYVRSMSMPASSKLVSAMKGGREQSGRSLEIKLCVQWAPEVYDPPATSMSHTVQRTHQRPKSKKKDQHKHKHKGKGKSTRCNGSERRHANKRSTGNKVDPSDMRLPETNDSMMVDECCQSTIELVDYSVGSQESKCGSSFIKESLAKMQYSIAEAS